MSQGLRILGFYTMLSFNALAVKVICFYDL